MLPLAGRVRGRKRKLGHIIRFCALGELVAAQGGLDWMVNPSRLSQQSFPSELELLRGLQDQRVRSSQRNNLICFHESPHWPTWRSSPYMVIAVLSQRMGSYDKLWGPGRL